MQTTFFHSNISQNYYIHLNYPRITLHVPACTEAIFRHVNTRTCTGRYSTIDGLIIPCCISQSTLLIKVFKQATFRKHVGRIILEC
jgi:hypothetical protein